MYALVPINATHKLATRGDGLGAIYSSSNFTPPSSGVITDGRGKLLYGRLTNLNLPEAGPNTSYGTLSFISSEGYITRGNATKVTSGGLLKGYINGNEADIYVATLGIDLLGTANVRLNYNTTANVNISINENVGLDLQASVVCNGDQPFKFAAAILF